MSSLTPSSTVLPIAALAPLVLMLAAALLARLPGGRGGAPWRGFLALSVVALAATIVAAGAVTGDPSAGHPVIVAALQASPFTLVAALLVQLLGTVVAAFSARYLQGEPGQRRFVAALAGVLAAVHLLLLADHWVVLIAAWALVGAVLQHLLCFYPDRPFALLAAHKKRIADRAADVLLVAAAALAWTEVGSGSMSDLHAHLEQTGPSTALQLGALALVLAVTLRTALLPVHGWLIQVMEAPTPVSALMHAGVVNLGGFVLIRFAPLLEQALPARALLVGLGLTTAALAGMVMLTRVTIKVRLAWSTVAQMGFMLLECGLGLYTLAALHLIGHSLYKAHAFLAASSVVRLTRQQALHGKPAAAPLALVLAPPGAIAAVLLVQAPAGPAAWPWWWSAILGLAWAPLLWVPGGRRGSRMRAVQAGCGVLMVAGLSAAALLMHRLPLGLADAPHHALGIVALLGMAALYLCVALLQWRPQALERWRRWSYAGFYVDEAFTRFALRLWPVRWVPQAVRDDRPRPANTLVADPR